MSCKVIDVGTPGKPVSSACYDQQQVCVYLHSAAVLTKDELITSGKITIFTPV